MIPLTTNSLHELADERHELTDSCYHLEQKNARTNVNIYDLNWQSSAWEPIDAKVGLLTASGWVEATRPLEDTTRKLPI